MQIICNFMLHTIQFLEPFNKSSICGLSYHSSLIARNRRWMMWDVSSCGLTRVFGPCPCPVTCGKRDRAVVRVGCSPPPS